MYAKKAGAKASKMKAGLKSAAGKSKTQARKLVAAGAKMGAGLKAKGMAKRASNLAGAGKAMKSARTMAKGITRKIKPMTK